jgi:hypothetical protein
LSFCMPLRHIGRKELELHSFLTSALDRDGGGVTPHPGRFTPGKGPQWPLNRRVVGLQRLPQRFGVLYTKLYNSDVQKVARGSHTALLPLQSSPRTNFRNMKRVRNSYHLHLPLIQKYYSKIRCVIDNTTHCVRHF